MLFLLLIAKKLVAASGRVRTVTAGCTGPEVPVADDSIRSECHLQSRPNAPDDNPQSIGSSAPCPLPQGVVPAVSAMTFHHRDRSLLYHGYLITGRT